MRWPNMRVLSTRHLYNELRRPKRLGGVMDWVALQCHARNIGRQA